MGGIGTSSCRAAGFCVRAVPAGATSNAFPSTVRSSLHLLSFGGSTAGESWILIQSACSPSGSSRPRIATSTRRRVIRVRRESKKGVRASQAGLRFTSSSQTLRKSSTMKSKPSSSKLSCRGVSLCCAACNVSITMCFICGKTWSSQKFCRPVILCNSSLNSVRDEAAPSTTLRPCLLICQFDMCLSRVCRSPTSYISLQRRR
mmetsp:Transcript_15898/g.29073  ORF Transcript_15898/g.29073 Transcript_15898/m.29073 type:complete len:203 (+) Transcript_15898:191-799(+)